ncbi:MAG: hypothetical protein F6J93_07780 [Oscillatoria sp. SIO1A7]|nr:hypothetical protein [Oscillatoria sp. SIO1A7]
MSISIILQQKIEKARAALHRDTQFDLNLGYRQAIWAAFDLNGEATSVKLGHKRRTMLAIITANRVLDIWESIWWQDDTPHCLLGAARLTIAQKLEHSQARAYRNEIWTKLENMASEPNHQGFEYQKAIAAGLSAVSALSTALDDEAFDRERIDEELTDADTDAYESDSSFWAAIAYAGATWEANGDRNKRREFWQWWLTEAVKNAWRSIPADSESFQTFPRQIELV